MPDSSLAANFIASPNHEPRPAGTVDMIVLHYTGMASGTAALERLRDPQAKVSSHYFIDEDGAIRQLVAESQRAYHAGVASWAGTTDINSRSIGIEIVNGGHDFGCPAFPLRQIESVIRLCKDLESRRRIPPAHVLAHSDVAPSRKRDPGEIFPWRTLFENGVGLWVEPEPICEGASLKMGDSGAAVSKLKTSLAAYGYGVNARSFFDEATRDVVTAFQRHFRAHRVDGIADVSTTRTLERLLRLRGEKFA